MAKKKKSESSESLSKSITESSDQVTDRPDSEFQQIERTIQVRGKKTLLILQFFYSNNNIGGSRN